MTLHRTATHKHAYTRARTGWAKSLNGEQHSLVLTAMFKFKAINTGMSQLQASLFCTEHGGSVFEISVNSVSNKEIYNLFA
jgi:hypothetical protein